ncbi:MAG: hemerythrin domain-containing protein [Magnetococcales bacterium]|nr:hemerythrin domain-containing protein [Magnetococcales bacterium]
MSKIIKTLQDEHAALTSVLTNISKSEFHSPERLELFKTLRTALVAHTEYEVKYFYDVLKNNSDIDEELRNVFEDDLIHTYKQTLDTLDTIIELGQENDGDLEFIIKTLSDRIQIEEKNLFPVYKACKSQQ